MWPFKDEPAKKEVKNAGIEVTEIEELADIFGLPLERNELVTARTAMRKVTAVYACVRIIAGSIASMPVKVYERGAQGRVEADNDPIYNLLKMSPDSVYSGFTFWESIVVDLLLRGQGYAEIVRPSSRSAQVSALRFIPADYCEPERKSDHLIYNISDEFGSRTLHQDDILHFWGVGFDGRKALSVIQNSMAISTAMEADTFANSYFKNGTHIGGYLKFPGRLAEDTKKALMGYWVKKFAGSKKAGSPAILTDGGEYIPYKVSAEDAQLIESRRYQIADISRIFGVPLFMINETEKSTSWGSGIEQQSIGFVRYTLKPHLCRIEQELNRKLFRSGERYAEFYTHSLIKGDTKATNESYKISLGGNQLPGWMTINEVRKLENLPPVDGGDELYKPLTGETNEQVNELDQEQS